MDFTTSFTAVAANLNNTGPGLGAVGPVGNYADFSILSKIVFIFDMLAGRLEIYPLLLLLHRLHGKIVIFNHLTANNSCEVIFNVRGNKHSG